ncbi:MAG: tRNA lysidine(34) synthetase TilS [Thermoguttaceae bacterium]|jgi:tRNA(Ile)-lysidine synthase
MLHSLESRLAEIWPPSGWADVTVLVAVSGGGDSVALLRAMAALKTEGEGRLCAAHLNHHLRAGADEDEQFVVDLCSRLGVACEVGHVDAGRLAAGDGIEAAARAARYRFLEKAAGRLGARFVATAHTADDQAETILHRIVRGTGIRGLSGMARTRPLADAVLIRPLLAVRRAELAAYLDAIQQPYRHDPSNADPRFTRNRIRHQLLPRLERHFNAEAAESLLRLGALASEAQAVIDQLVDQCFERCVVVEGPNGVRIDLVRLARHGGADIPVCPAEGAEQGRQECLPHRPRYLVRELLMAVWRRAGWPMQSMGMLKWDELCELATSVAPSTRRVFPGGVVVEITGGEMRLLRVR